MTPKNRFKKKNNAAILLLNQIEKKIKVHLNLQMHNLQKVKITLWILTTTQICRRKCWTIQDHLFLKILIDKSSLKLTSLMNFICIENKLSKSRIHRFLKIFFKYWIRIWVSKLINLTIISKIQNVIAKLKMPIRTTITWISRIQRVKAINLLFLVKKLKILSVMSLKTPLKRWTNQAYLSSIHNHQVSTTLTKILDSLD